MTPSEIISEVIFAVDEVIGEAELAKAAMRTMTVEDALLYVRRLIVEFADDHVRDHNAKQLVKTINVDPQTGRWAA